VGYNGVVVRTPPQKAWWGWSQLATRCPRGRERGQQREPLPRRMHEAARSATASIRKINGATLLSSALSPLPALFSPSTSAHWKTCSISYHTIVGPAAWSDWVFARRV